MNSNNSKDEDISNSDDFEKTGDRCKQVVNSDIDGDNICSPYNEEIASATNPNVVTSNSEAEEKTTDNIDDVNSVERTNIESVQSQDENRILHKEQDNMSDIVKSKKKCSDMQISSKINVNENKESKSSNGIKYDIKHDLGRLRKLSLDHSLLSRSEGLSQSELNLSNLGKKPLERKPSFFRKRMDIFLRNTTEMFKKRSGQQQGSPKSGSLQSLNENTLTGAKSDENFQPVSNNQEDTKIRDGNSLAVPPLGRSVSSLSVYHSGRLARQPSEQSLAGSQPVLHTSTDTLEDIDLSSVHSLNESFLREHMLKSRAISMNSGLDSPMTQQRKRASRSNRVTWVASEGLSNYFRRFNQDEKKSEMQACQSYQDFSCIPENELYKKKADSKGRRLSYQRAVSGEDPVLPMRYQDSSMRTRNPIPENSETHPELEYQLAQYTANGIPSLKGFEVVQNADEVFAYVLWAESPSYIGDVTSTWQGLTAEERKRQAVIKELLNTEADYIRYLVSVVEVFIATAHSLQDSGKMLGVDTEKLFNNFPDLLNASINFFRAAFLPMVKDSVTEGRPFNTELMAPGFYRFAEIFIPYERYVKEQSKTMEYLKSVSSDPEFAIYLAWCHKRQTCNRLQLSDFLAKPMQRLTKYGLILRRIINHTNTEPDRTTLLAMESFTRSYVLDLNRSVRQREELERLEAVANSVEPYEVDFKDDDLDRYFRLFSHLNLRSPMVNCVQFQSRSVVFQGDLRFRDNVKEIDVHVFLLTDMLLVCKKMTKGNYPYKLIRPKYMIDRMIQFPKFVNRSNKDLSALLYVIVDEVGSSYTSFYLSEMPKDPNPIQTLRTWELKVREAKMTYDLSVWYARNPHRDLSEMEIDSSDYTFCGMGASTPEDSSTEMEARERVAVMLHRSMGASTDFDISQSMTTESFEGASGGRPPGLQSLRHLMHRTSTASSRNSRLSSFQQSTSAASHDDPHAAASRSLCKSGTSGEHNIMPCTSGAVTSITVNVVSDGESDTIIPGQQDISPLSKSSDSKSPGSHKTLQVQTPGTVATLVHSLPDLTIEPSTPRSTSSPVPSASEKMYQSHQELLQRNRLVVAQQHQYLSPDHRGSSYPPPSPTRASLKRGLAFSYSFKNPPLSKMGHVNSQSQVQTEAGASATHHGKIERPSSSRTGTGNEKSEKKTKLISSSSFFKSGGWHSKLDG